MLILRRLRPGEADFERLWLAVLGGGGAFALGWLGLGLPTPACLFHAVTGVPCLTCGGTRCVRSLLAGEAARALAWNPLVAMGVFAAAVFVLYAVVVTVFRLPRVRLGAVPWGVTSALWICAGLALAANWIYLIVRFSRGA